MLEKAFQKVMVIGAGTMGHALAQTFAQGGLNVYCVDKDRAVIEKARSLIETNLGTLEAQGIIEKGTPGPILQRIEMFVGLDQAPRDAELIVEAIYEDEAVKHDLFEQIDRLFSEETIIASNTSYLNVFKVAAIRNPSRLIITHWYTPPHIVPLVEVVKGPETSRETTERILLLLRQLGKKPIVLEHYLPGFIVNRLQRMLGKEIFYLLDNGIVSARDLDTAVKYSLGVRIPVVGVVQRYDYAGLDFSLMAQKNAFIAKEFNEVPSITLERLVKEGHLGVKTGKGFYDYHGKSHGELLRERDERLLKVKDLIDEFERDLIGGDDEEREERSNSEDT